MTTFDDAFTATERGRAARALLADPMLSRDTHPDAFELVSRHAQWLATWFSAAAGWTLLVDDRRGFARLRKDAATVSTSAESRPAQTRRYDSRPFDSTRYMLTALVAAAALRGSPQVTIEELATRVTLIASERDDLPELDFANQSMRRALVDATAYLIDVGCFVLADSLGDWASGSGGNILFTVQQRRITQLLQEPVRDADLGTSVIRQLLQDPVLYFDDADPSVREWLTKNARRVSDTLDAVGLTLELRAEGAAAVSLLGDGTDLVFPGPDSTIKHAALILLDAISERHPRGMAFDLDAAAGVVAETMAANPNWAKTYQAYRNPPQRLATDALELLEGLGLAQAAGDAAYRLGAAAGRFRVAVAAS